MGPQDLADALAGLSYFRSPDVLVATETMDDAGVYRVSDDLALIQTVDFFTPIVDDPGDFGEIAVANALSDVYAMGGEPVTALNILCYPMDTLGADVLHDILAGGARKLEEAGASCLGGHSVTDDELKYGCAVTGTVHPDRIWRNRGALPGDALVLSKALGTGILGTAQKAGKLEESHLESLTASLKMLNRASAEAAAGFDVHACTDVTGFGLAGHGGGIAVSSGVTLRIDTTTMPLLPGAEAHATAGHLTRGDRSNREMFAGRFEIGAGVSKQLASVVFDPQTSGGLLTALPADQADDLVAALKDSGCPQATRIGEVCEADPSSVLSLM